MIDLNLPESPLFWLLAVAGILLTGISKSGFAGGAGVVAVPLLALVLPVSQAVAMVLPLLLLMDARTVYLYRRHIERRWLLALLPAGVLGIGIGGFLLGVLPDFWLLLLLGVVSLVFAGWQKLAPRLSQFRGSGWLWGSLSGLTSTLVHAGGPPLNIFLLGLQLPKGVWLATAAVFFGVMNLIKLIPYTLIGSWQGVPWAAMVVLIPVAYVGVGMGHWLQGRLSDALFVRCCRFLLAVTGVMLIVKSFWPLG